MHFSFSIPAGMVVSTVPAGKFVSVCPLVAVVVRHAGVHFSFCIPAGMVVSPLAAENLAPYARWSLSLLASPACIFRFVSPLA